MLSILFGCIQYVIDMTLESNRKLHTGICSWFRLLYCIETWFLYYYITSVFTVHHQIKGFWCTFWSRQHLLDAAFQFFIQIVLNRFHGNRLTLQSSRIVVWLCGQFICERNVYCSGCKIGSIVMFSSGKVTRIVHFLYVFFALMSTLFTFYSVIVISFVS